MTFPERLKFTRKEQEMTQKRLAEIAGIAKNSLSQYEAGKVDPTTFVLCCLADALGVTTDYLLGRTDKR